jgi:hypothetical protein
MGKYYENLAADKLLLNCADCFLVFAQTNKAYRVSSLLFPGVWAVSPNAVRTTRNSVSSYRCIFYPRCWCSHQQQIKFRNVKNTKNILVLKAGEYEVNFNGENYPSGLYFYVLESDDYVSTKKMVLIK